MNKTKYNTVKSLYDKLNLKEDHKFYTVYKGATRFLEEIEEHNFPEMIKLDETNAISVEETLKSLANLYTIISK